MHSITTAKKASDLFRVLELTLAASLPDSIVDHVSNGHPQSLFAVIIRSSGPFIPTDRFVYTATARIPLSMTPVQPECCLD